MMRKTSRLLSLSALCAASLGFASCLSLKQDFPEKRYFVIEATRAGEANGPAERAALQMTRFRVSPLYDRPGFVYRIGELSFESDFYNEFFVSPDALLTEQTRRWLSETGLFTHVTERRTLGETELLLEGSVARLYGDYHEKDPPEAVLEMQFLLVRNDSAQFEIVFQKSYAASVPLDDPSPEGLAEGWSRGLRYILTAFEYDLRALDSLGDPPR